MTQITPEWAKKAMDLAIDYGVDSLRVGSHERKDIIQNNHGYTWETIQLRKKREKSREALTRHLFSAVSTEPKTECTNSDTWNCKYCRNTQTCDALNDDRNFGGTVKPEPEDKPDTVAAPNGLKVNIEVLCDKLATARVALADAEANMKLLRDLFVNENSSEPN